MRFPAFQHTSRVEPGRGLRVGTLGKSIEGFSLGRDIEGWSSARWGNRPVSWPCFRESFDSGQGFIRVAQRMGHAAAAL